MIPTNENIIHQLKQPVSDLLGWLYERYAKNWYGLATVRWGLDADIAWEMIYKTLDTILVKRNMLPTDPPIYFDNYLFKIFINNLKQSIRDQAKKEETFKLVPISNEFDVDSEELDLSNDHFNQIFEEDSESTTPLLIRLEKALTRLEETDRSLLLLKAQHFSYEEIAEMLNIENKQLKVRHFRAKQKLINHFNQVQP